ncbi:hypothetical protein BGZ73_002084 [Actinomortierella ambigua]|nr:hypothetical protein BGZ73_002084 [Actinomortierella ambigua]
MKMKDSAGRISISVALLLVATSSLALLSEAAPVVSLEGGGTPVLKSIDALASGLPTDDPCLQATSAKYPIAYDVVKACLDANFLFPDDNFNKTVTSLKKLVAGSYVFEDLAADPPVIEGFSFGAVRITEELDNLLSKAIPSAGGLPTMTPRQFHTEISRIMIRAKDAHLGYQADCFSQFNFDFGFYMGEEWDSVRRISTLRVQSTLSSFRSLSSLNFEPAGCEIVTIDGRPARTVIEQWAFENISHSKDANSRYNRALSKPVFAIGDFPLISKGSFAQRSELPDKPSYTFGFRCPNLWGRRRVRKVNVKWGAKYKGAARSILDYYNTHCVVKEASSTFNSGGGERSVSKAQSISKPAGNVDAQDQLTSRDWSMLSLAEREELVTQTVEQFKAMPAWLSSRTETVILGQEEGSAPGAGWTGETDEDLLRERAKKILQLMPNNEKVPQLPIFQPLETVAPSLYERFHAANTGFRVLLDSPYGLYAPYAPFFANLLEAIDVLRPVAKHLIIDVSGNGGGGVCLSRRFAQIFFPDTPETVSNIRFTNLEGAVIDVGDSRAFNFLNPEGESVEYNYLTTLVKPSNRRAVFTNYLFDSCKGYLDQQLKVDPDAEANRPRSIEKGYVYNPDKPYYPWDAEDILIFSDGLCGSACATFTNQLVQKNNVRSVVYGGNPASNRPFSFSSFPGGQVLRAEDYFEYRATLESINFTSIGLSGDDGSGVPVLNRRANGNEDDATMAATNQGKGNSDTLAEMPITKEQRDRLLELFPEPFQQRGYFSFTWRQNYNTGNVQDIFVRGNEGTLMPNWGPNIEQWTEYSFLPATYRIQITPESFERYSSLWEAAVRAAW